MLSFSAILRSPAAGRGGFLANRQASVGIIFALAAVPILFGFGMGLDYVAAARRREQLSAIADSAALSATTPGMMKQTALQAKLVATSLFLAQARQIGGVTDPTVDIGVTDTFTDGNTVRKVTVAYTAGSPNTFSKLLRVDTIGLSGNSASSNAIPPNTNFFVLLDSSPSMAIAATPNGIKTMQANTKAQESGNGCAFACHQIAKDSSLGNPGNEDNYALARDLKVTLRIDLVSQAAQDLMTFLNQQATSGNTNYAATTYSFDWQTTQLGSRSMTDVRLNLAQAKNDAASMQMLTVYSNNMLTSNKNNNDQDTDWDAAIGKLNSDMPTPGTGTNNISDKPQEVLLIVTDGVEDEPSGGSRKQSYMGGDMCTTIKKRGIRIAVLYTTYNPLPASSWYKSYIAPIQDQIGPALQSCASPGLYSVVDTGDDISGALKTLTSKVLTVAHLTQ